MSLLKLKECEEGKQRKNKSMVFLKHSLSCHPTYPNPTSIISNSLRGDSSKQGDNAGYLDERSFTRHTVTTGHMGDSKLPKWHYQMEQAFDSFLLRLDDIFLSLSRDVPNRFCANVEGYKDICEKLRTEILIASDKLDFLAVPACNLTQEQEIFLKKLNDLKIQLCSLRWEYHKAIKELAANMT